MKTVREILLILALISEVKCKVLIKTDLEYNLEQEITKSSNHTNQNNLLLSLKPTNSIIPLEHTMLSPIKPTSPSVIFPIEPPTWPPPYLLRSNWKPPTPHPNTESESTYIQPPGLGCEATPLASTTPPTPTLAPTTQPSMSESPTTKRPGSDWEPTTQPPLTQTSGTILPGWDWEASTTQMTEIPTTQTTTFPPGTELPEWGWEPTSLPPTTLIPMTQSQSPTTQPKNFGWTSTTTAPPTPAPCVLPEPEKSPNDSNQVIKWVASLIDRHLRGISQLSTYQINKIKKNFVHSVQSELTRTKVSPINIFVSYSAFK